MTAGSAHEVGEERATVDAVLPGTPPSFNDHSDIGDRLLNLLGSLAAQHYRFITPTPLTHQRVLAHRALSDQPFARTARDVFGWNLPFTAASIPPDLMDLMDLIARFNVARSTPDFPRQSTVRVSTLGSDLFVHSSFPTTQSDAVFFGPDTYRFARFVTQSVASSAGEKAGKGDANTPFRILDLGCGSGAGGIACVRACIAASIGTCTEDVVVTFNDINPLALQFAAVNARSAGIACNLLPGDAMTSVTGFFDVIIANPPYLDDPFRRAYRHGGAGLGRELSLRMARLSLQHLAPGGSLLLYTGVAITAGIDPFLAELSPVLDAFDGHWTYSEIDPDVFGEELDGPVYGSVDRIAAVGLTVRRHHCPSLSG